MAIYHFSAKVISRANGSSALAAAAYRSASWLHDERLDRHHDFTNKTGVVHSEVMLPNDAPEEWRDRERLWNDVEAAELRKDAQLAREVEFAIPRELDQQQGIELARDFVNREFVDRGMVADLNVHWDIGADGEAKPHAHVMLTMREVDGDGFGAKVRDWNRTDLLNHWREAWANHANQRLAELDIDARIDHRSLEAQGIELEPQHKIGSAAARMAAEGLDRERVAEHHAIARNNGEKIIAEPRVALDAITHQQATFTNRDLAMFVHRHSEGKEQFDQVMVAVKAAPELIALGKDGLGEERFTSRDMIETEQRLERAAERMAGRSGHGLPAAALDRAIAATGSGGLVLGREQQAALAHVTERSDLAMVVGYAGTGKSAMLGIARDGWEQAGYRVQGLALSGIAAENLESGSGIASRTIASLEHQWGQGRELLSANDVLVIDEAGMIGSRQMERVVSEAEKHGAKIVLVGDTEQLQAIEAGAAFRSLAERHGAVEITEIRRQREDWQRNATRQLATGRTSEAIGAYAGNDMVHQAESREDARGELIECWDRERKAAPTDSRIILTHTNDEVRALNDAARERMRAGGELGEDIAIQAERGERNFGEGDRIMFLRNERSIGVKNGSLGTIQSVTSARMVVTLDDGRALAFDTKDYAAVDHGYAATIHKAQGMTVDRTHVLATPGLDRHGFYVALSRHRDGVQLHYGRDDFADQGRLVRTLSRERVKDMASDYEPAQRFAERRGIGIRDRVADMVRKVPEKVRGMFDGLNLGGQSTGQPDRGMFDGLKLNARPTAPERTPLDPAVERFARATADVVATRRQHREELPHERAAWEKAEAALNAVHPEAARDMREAFSRNPALIDAAAKGRTTQAIRAMMVEAEVRTNPSMRADRFVQDWSRLAERKEALRSVDDDRGVARIQKGMHGLAKSLERDPQIESLVRQRLPEIGIRIEKGASLSHDLQKWLSRSRDIGLSL
jgi:Ti-type conjugative transfer relaxase TraA